MDKVRFPLVPKMHGPEVANLQAALRLLLERALLTPNERTREKLMAELQREYGPQSFGSTTRKLVSLFQQTKRLEGEGSVDEVTAMALNAELGRMGLLDANKMRDHLWTVAGQVRHADGRPIAGAAVRLFHQDERGCVRLGEDLSDAEGRYAIRYARLPAGSKSRLRLTAEKQRNTPVAEAELEETHTPLERVDLVCARETDADAQPWQVRGRVSAKTSGAVEGLLVRIVDKCVGEDVPLAEARTDERGAFVAEFSPRLFEQRGKPAPDLQAQAYVEQRRIGTSPVRYDAEPGERLDIEVSDEAAGTLASEYQTVTSAVGRHVKGGLEELVEEGERSDITYLANKTGWDARAVAFTSLAAQFSARTGQSHRKALSAPLFYALFRAGVPAHESALYRVDADTVRRLWTTAIERGVIPKIDVDEAVERFTRIAADRLLDAPALVGVSSLKELVSISLPDAGMQTRFAELYTAHRGDTAALWTAVERAFDPETAGRMKVDGQLAYLTLNNAPLIRTLHQVVRDGRITDPAQLVDAGYHRAQTWREALANAPVPPGIDGDDEALRRDRYAEVVSAQVRLSYPTRVVAQMVAAGETRLSAPEAAADVRGFLLEHEANFDIGTQPVAQYVSRARLQVRPELLSEITRIQRVHQLTPTDTAMNALLDAGLDSAHAVTRYDRETFVRHFGQRLGSVEHARLVHGRAQQVHNAVLNVAVSYLSSATAPAVGVHSPAQIINPAPGPNPNATDVIAYSTLEKLFGSMDYCACEHCRSILSPAAYLVDLLLFCDRPENEKENPLDVLLERRPDLQHLPLTCENTHTPLPYVDIVNETLEYYATNGLSLLDFEGHSHDGRVKAEVLSAHPQFVTDAAYTLLAGRPQNPSDPLPLLPPAGPLPFHQPLEKLRRLVSRFDVTLPEVMETLRQSDALERPSPSDPTRPVEIGWRDIWMEELQLSRAEHALLTDGSRTLQSLYGFAPATSQAEVLTTLSNARKFANRMGVTYLELADLLRTRFINPTATLLPKLERLGISFTTIKAFNDGTLSTAELEDRLAPHLDASDYGGDVGAWLTQPGNYGAIMRLITLSAPADADAIGAFDAVELRYANPDPTANALRPFDFIRLHRFVRLWKKLGWSIEETDRAVAALYPSDQTPNDTNDAVNLARLDAGMRVLLPRLGMLSRMSTALNLKRSRDLQPQLACFSDLDTYGQDALYRQMFLSSSPHLQDPAFADGGSGDVLGGSERLLAHAPALRAAFGLTDEELTHLTGALGYTATTPLTLPNISAIFRRGWLSRKLKLGVRELLGLISVTGIDPFAAPVPVNPPMLRFLSLVERLKASSLKPAEALALIWNVDVTGRTAGTPAAIEAFARNIRTELDEISRQFRVTDDPSGQLAPDRMAQVLGKDTSDAFFGLLDGRTVTDVDYAHNQARLSQELLNASGGHLAYDDLRKRLAWTAGVMPDAVRTALLAVSGTTSAFDDAVSRLHAKTRALFLRHPELAPLHDAFVASTQPVEVRRATLLAALLPPLERRRKHQHALQALGAALGADATFVSALCDDASVLHAAGDATRSAVNDVLALEQRGLSVRWYFANTATGAVGAAADTVETLSYSPATQPVVAHPTAGAPVSGVWSGYLEVPESGFYNLRVRTDGAAQVSLRLGGVEVSMTNTGGVWRNDDPLELTGGLLRPLSLTVEGVTSTLSVEWRSAALGWEIIPGRFLHSGILVDRVRDVYMRVSRALALARGLTLSATELAALAAKPSLRVGTEAWLNVLPVLGAASATTAVALFDAFWEVLQYARLKKALRAPEDRLLHILHDAAAATATDDALLYTLTRWERSAVDALLVRFGHVDGGGAADREALGDLTTFAQVFDAYALLQQMRVAPSALFAVATNEPDAAGVRTFEDALRARYGEGEWLATLKPINDAMRSLQRDALVAYVLHQMKGTPGTAHLDTPEKLFEYFLMDVQMQPCMDTSRIRHALSSVQLFIERCLMNLEPRVAPSSINAKQWDWMRRYRVWELNRKIFLFPENTAEPELRDDMSIFFKETISGLLQSDITDDAAASALLGYLSKLEEVAKLEPCGIHYAEYDGAKTEDDVAHIVARTSGARRKYFYRRYAYGSWTPWEPIKLDIEDDPVTPVLWKNRLLLFWLKAIPQTPLQPPTLPSGDLTELDASATVNSNSRISMKVLLCWSEYYDGKWQPVKTSAPNQPVHLGTFAASGDGAFNRSKLRLSVVSDGPTLQLSIWGQGSAGFTLYNTHSLPQPGAVLDLLSLARTRTLDTSTQTLKATYSAGWNFSYADPAPPLVRPILKNTLTDRVVVPEHPLGDPWTAPFFYEDARHVFFVKTRERPVTVKKWPGFEIEKAPPKQFEIPNLVFEQPPIKDPLGPVVNPQWAGLDPAGMSRFVTEDAYIRRALPNTQPVEFGGSLIGPGGVVGAAPRR